MAISDERGFRAPSLVESRVEHREQLTVRKIRMMLKDVYARFEKTGDVSYHGLVGDDLDIMDIRERWSNFFEDAETNQDGYYTKEHQRNAELFFDGLIEQFVELRRRNVEPWKIRQYATKWYHRAFSVSPNLFNAVEFDQSFVIASRMFGVPEARESMGSNLEGEMVYKLEFSRGEYTWLDNVLKAYPLETQLDVLHYMEHIGRASAYEGYASNVIPRLRHALAKKLEQRSLNPIERYATEATVLRLNREYVQAGGELQEEDVLFEDGLIRAKQSGESAWWRSRVMLSRMSDAQEPIARISADYVAAIDRHRDTPEALARIPEGIESEPASLVDYDQLNRLHQLLNEQNTVKRPQSYREALRIIIAEILPALTNQNTSVQRDLSRIFPEISEAEWTRILATEQRNAEQHLQEQLRIQAALQSADNENERLFQTIISLIEAKRPALATLAQRIPQWKNWLQEYDAAETDEQRFSMMQSLQVMGSYAPETMTDDVRDILEYFHAVQAEQQENFEAADKLRLSIMAERKTPVQDYRLVELLRDQKFPQQVRVFEEELRHRFPIRMLEAQLFEQFEGNQEILPRGSKQPIDSALLLKELHRPEIRSRIEKDLELDLRQLMLREQIHLLSFMAKATQNEYERVARTIRAHGLNSARAFLSCEHGKEYGEAILQIGETFDHETAARVFEVYAEIIDLTDQTAEELQQAFFTHAASPRIDVSAIKEQLIDRGRSIIHQAAFKIERAINLTDAAAQLQDQLRRYRGDVVLFSSVFREATKGSKHTEFRDWSGVRIESLDPQKISPLERKRLFERCEDVLRSNWADKGIEASATALHGLEDGFAKKKAPTRFHLLRRNDEVIAFVRFDERPDMGDNVRYAGSFNVDPAARMSAIGSAFFHEVLKEEGKNRDIRAHVLIDDRVAANYVEEFGFVITGVERDSSPDGSTTDWFTIRRDEALNERLFAKSSEHQQDETSLQIKSFHLPQERDQMMEWVRAQTNEGRVISRYRSRQEGKKEIRELIAESPVKEKEQKMAA